MSGYAAAAAFCAVSVGANLQYGLSLGRNPIDKATYAVASVAADVFKIAAPLLALSLWSKRFHILAIAGLVLWLGCVGWSMASAVGFVLSSRGEAIAERAAEAATRHGWEAKVERAESQLATLGKHRPPDVIKAELAVCSCSSAHLETQPPMPRSDLGGEPFGLCASAGFAKGAGCGRGS